MKNQQPQKSRQNMMQELIQKDLQTLDEKLSEYKATVEKLIEDCYKQNNFAQAINESLAAVMEIEKLITKLPEEHVRLQSRKLESIKNNTNNTSFMFNYKIGDKVLVEMWSEKENTWNWSQGEIVDILRYSDIDHNTYPDVLSIKCNEEIVDVIEDSVKKIN